MAFAHRSLKSGAAFLQAPIQYTATVPPVSTVTGVTLTPAAVTLAGGTTQQFDWTVDGTNSPSQAVTLAATAGDIDAGGLFTGPAATDTKQTIVVTATSEQNPNYSDEAVVTILAIGAPDPVPGGQLIASVRFIPLSGPRRRPS